jgi:hypothetical protein
MSKTLPVRKLRGLIREVRETTEEDPRSGFDFLLRCQYAANSRGEVGVKINAQAPAEVIEAKLGVGVSRDWTQVGDGEFVLRIYRSTPEARSIAAVRAAEMALKLATMSEVDDSDRVAIGELLATARQALLSEVD